MSRFINCPVSSAAHSSGTNFASPHDHLQAKFQIEACMQELISVASQLEVVFSCANKCASIFTQVCRLMNKDRVGAGCL